MTDDKLFLWNDNQTEEEMKLKSIIRSNEEESEYDAESEDDFDEGDEDLAERLSILSDCKALKNLAIAFLHPEIPVHSHPALYGRNYFNRYSSPSSDERILGVEETKEEEMEVEQILLDLKHLKEAAQMYLHPEMEIEVDGECFGRNYFSRYTAPEVESFETMTARNEILTDAAALKKLAVDYMHPELGVNETVGEVYGRNYFERYSAPEMESVEIVKARNEILTDAAALKKLAVDYMHPELGVNATDGECYARNFFDRPSALTIDDVDEIAQIFADAAALKKLAVDYLHPEIGVKCSGGVVFGRNYFDRYFSPEVESVETMNACNGVLEDAAALKKLAVDYMHPEIGIVTVDGEMFGRNYFDRYSAPEVESVEIMDARNEILADAAALKKLAVNYMHPEVGLGTADGEMFGRNYFDRPSAPTIDDVDEVARILVDAAALKKLAVDYMHPEIGVKCSGGAMFGRNYFDRYSAPRDGIPSRIKEEKNISQDLAVMQDMGKAVKGLNLPGMKSSKLTSGSVRLAPKSASAVHLFGLGDEFI